MKVCDDTAGQATTIDYSITSHKIREWQFGPENKQKKYTQKPNLNSPNIIRFYSEAHFRSCTILVADWKRVFSCFHAHHLSPTNNI